MFVNLLYSWFYCKNFLATAARPGPASQEAVSSEAIRDGSRGANRCREGAGAGRAISLPPCFNGKGPRTRLKIDVSARRRLPRLDRRLIHLLLKAVTGFLMSEIFAALHGLNEALFFLETTSKNDVHHFSGVAVPLSGGVSRLRFKFRKRTSNILSASNSAVSAPLRRIPPPPPLCQLTSPASAQTETPAAASSYPSSYP
jgi:hypothetical protein